MSIKAHHRKKTLFKAFSFATYKGWSVFVTKGAAVLLRPSQLNKMAKSGGTRAHLSQAYSIENYSTVAT